MTRAFHGSQMEDPRLDAAAPPTADEIRAATRILQRLQQHPGIMQACDPDTLALRTVLKDMRWRKSSLKRNADEASAGIVHRRCNMLKTEKSVWHASTP